MQSEIIDQLPVGEDLENIKQKLGGLRIERRCTIGTMFVAPTSHQFPGSLLVGQRVPFHRLPSSSSMLENLFDNALCIRARRGPVFHF